MTFREILSALWRRAWIIVAMMVLAALVAGVYLWRLTPSYESSTTVRISPVMTEAISTGVLGGVPVDVDPSVVATPTVLDAAAGAVDAPTAALAGAVSATVVQTEQATAATTSVTVTATATDPARAQQWAKAAAASYGTYLDGVVDETTKALTDQRTDVEKKANGYAKKVAKSETDQVAQANLASAVSSLNTLNSSITALQSAGTSVAVTSPAAPGASTNPSTLTVAGIALLCGLLAGMGIALIRDHFDDRIRTADDLDAVTDLPVLGTLAADRRVARRKDRLPAAGRARTALGEGIRSLRTSVQVLLPHGAGMVVVTSVEPGDGKTFLSANLATSWARSGRTVVLVEGDLRRPEAAAYFPDAMGGPGLSGLLARAQGEPRSVTAERVAQALQPATPDGLRVLPPGEAGVDPADALAGAGLERILRHLKRLADIVVIDTPPALALADASVLGAHADGVVLLTTARRTRRTLIVQALETLEAGGARVFGLVVNRVRQRLPKSYSSYYLKKSPARHTTIRPPAAPVQEPDVADVPGEDDVLAATSASVEAEPETPDEDVDERGPGEEGTGDVDGAAVHPARSGRH